MKQHYPKFILPWEFASGRSFHDLGLIPVIILRDDPRPVAEQLNDRYSHGGGWRPMARWKLNIDTREAQYPGDPRFQAIAWARLREERLMFFPYSWMAIIQPDDSFEMGRLD